MAEPGIGKSPERDGFGGSTQGPESQATRGGASFAGIGGIRDGRSGSIAKLFPRIGDEPLATVPRTGGLLTSVPVPDQQPVTVPVADPVIGVPSGPVTAPVPATSPSAQFEPADASVATQLDKFLASDSPLLAAARTRAKQDANRRGLLNSSIAVQAGEAAALDVALPIASQQAAQVQQRNLQERQIVSSEKISESGIAAQERIAASNIAAFDREKATAAVAALDASYQQVFANLSGNTDIPAEAREAYLIHLAALRDSNFGLIEQLYNINLVWASPSTGGVA